MCKQVDAHLRMELLCQCDDIGVRLQVCVSSHDQCVVHVHEDRLNTTELVRHGLNRQKLPEPTFRSISYHGTQ